MKKPSDFLLLFICGVVLLSFNDAYTAPTSSSRQLKPAHVEAPEYQPPVDASKAKRLFRCVQKENKRLTWDRCLADRAVKRARDLARRNYFGHKDPRSGKNRAWDLIASCCACRYGGENLSKGDSSAEEIHRLFMKSRSHRKNILSHKFNLVGIGCYRDICVELFAGL